MNMKQKRILNYVFIANKDNYKVIEPSGETKLYDKETAEKLYRKLYAIKYADNLCLDVIKKLGYTKDNIHLTGEEVKGKFRKELEYLLYKNNIDLSYDSVITSKFAIKISGNRGGIVSSYIVYLWPNQWVETKMTIQDIVKYVKKGHDLYKTVRYDTVKVDNPLEYLRNVKLGTETNYRGIGSQSSIAETTVKVKKDKLGNLLIDNFTIVYD